MVFKLPVETGPVPCNESTMYPQRFRREHNLNFELFRPRAASATAPAKSLPGYKYSTAIHGDLVKLLSHPRMCKASDPRDHVYAFVGLVDPGYSIIPDYASGNTIQNVLSKTAQCIILHEENLDVLIHTDVTQSRLQSTLPSWVPDWTSDLRVTGFPGIGVPTADGVNSSRTKGAACRGAKLDATFADEGKILKTSGILVDTLAGKGPRSDNGYCFLTSKHHFRVFVNDAILGDQVWILCGATIPFFLRSVNDRFKFVSGALVFTTDDTVSSLVMDGELFSSPEGVAARRRIQIC
jgi:hypothetical protein